MRTHFVARAATEIVRFALFVIPANHSDLSVRTGDERAATVSGAIPRPAGRFGSSVLHG